MRTIRSNVFETNSSSTHSVSIHNGDSKASNLEVDYDNKIHVEFGEFGWGYDRLETQYEKLQYLCTIAIEIEGRKLTKASDFFETDGFKMINDVIISQCRCDGIWIDSKIAPESYEWGGETVHYLDHDGYVDHQSHEDYETLDAYLDDWKTNVSDFVFNNGVTVIIDNDNH